MLQGAEDSRLLLNTVIAVPLVIDPTDDGVVVCRLDPRSGRASIESTGAGRARRAVHMTSQAGERQLQMPEGSTAPPCACSSSCMRPAASQERLRVWIILVQLCGVRPTRFAQRHYAALS